LNLAKFLNEYALKLSNNESDTTILAIKDIWINNDFVYKKYILNDLDDISYVCIVQLKICSWKISWLQDGWFKDCNKPNSRVSIYLTRYLF
jgi:hypothetical protein